MAFQIESLPAQEASPILGERIKQESVSVDGRQLNRILLRSGNYDLKTGTHYTWLDESDLLHPKAIYPEWALLVERLTWGRFYGFPLNFRIDSQLVADSPEEVWQKMKLITEN